MKVAVIGAGHVGLITGACLADVGHCVCCVDVDVDKVRQLQSGQLPFFEPGLEALYERNRQAGRLQFTSVLEEGIQDAEVIFLALPTPTREDDSADLSIILSVADQLGRMINRYVVIIDKSTVPVGTAERVHDEIAKSCNHPFDVVSNPEFLREGRAIEDFTQPTRIVVGASSKRAKAVVEKLYGPYLSDEKPMVIMDERSAEMTKYASNSFLATKITFMNEVANLCEKVGADVDQVRLGMSLDPRIGSRFLFPGIGYGGSCFPKDVRALMHTARDHQYDFRILETVAEINEIQRTRLLPRLRAYFQNRLGEKTFAVWGLAFKPDTDDIREAPSLYNIPALRAEGVRIKAYDPAAMEKSKKALGAEGISYCDDMYEALEGVDALLIYTDWEQFRSPDFERMKKLMRNQAIFDGRNLYETDAMEAQGFYYVSIGRRTINRKQIRPNWM